jgi:hypothetical protein
MENQDKDLTRLSQFLLGFAEAMLTKNGEFYPFAAIVNAEGKVAACAIDLSPDQPSMSDFIETVERSLEHSLSSGQARLTGLAINVNIPPAIKAPYPDGVRLDLGGGSIKSTVYVPYRMKRAGLLKMKRSVEFSASITDDRPAEDRVP